jgi:hypothetical protein
MASVFLWKDVLHPGRSVLPDGREVTFTAEHSRNAHQNLQRMISKGLTVPCCWEHQPGAKPVLLSANEQLANRSKLLFGAIVGSKVDAHGVLWARHEIYKPEDAEHLSQSKQKVSPKLVPGYRDQTGEKYFGPTVTHVAATPTPVQYWQKPFELSDSDALYLSYSPEGDDVPDPIKPNDDKPKGDGDFKNLVEALKGSGMKIPEEVTDIPGLIIAVKASGKAEPDSDDDMDDDFDDDFELDSDPADPAAVPGGGPPVVMSMTPKVKKWVRRDRKSIAERIRGAFRTGRITKPEAHQLLRQAETVELSYAKADASLVPNKLLKALDEVEKRAANSKWKSTGGDIDLSMTDAGGSHPLHGGESNDAKKALEAQEALAKKYSVPAAK